jgi:beta-carotene ketolase (CrtW type)
MSSTTRRGLLLSALIVLGWLISLISLLGIDITQQPWLALGVAVLLRTVLQTGLFIVGHDAMHGVLIPAEPRWNHRLGGLALYLYGALPYEVCRRNHQRHHQVPATADDPDFHDAGGTGAMAWYRTFMARYLTAGQMLRLLTSWGVLAVIARAHSSSGWINVLLFCTLPLLLSSLQLFIVGTYLPHRNQRAPLHRANPDSLDWPTWLSLLACFHFGYHREHHDNPALAWFELPQAQRCRRALANP